MKLLILIYKLWSVNENIYLRFLLPIIVQHNSKQIWRILKYVFKIFISQEIKIVDLKCKISLNHL